MTTKIIDEYIYLSLSKIRDEWYMEAKKDGTMHLLRKIAMNRGIQVSDIAKQWNHEDIDIYASIRSPYLRVNVGLKTVVRHHHDARLFVRGDWLIKIIPFAGKAQAKYLESKVAEYRLEKEDLLRQLNLVNLDSWDIDEQRSLFNRQVLLYELDLVDFMKYLSSQSPTTPVTSTNPATSVIQIIPTSKNNLL